MSDIEVGIRFEIQKCPQHRVFHIRADIPAPFTQEFIDKLAEFIENYCVDKDMKFNKVLRDEHEILSREQ